MKLSCPEKLWKRIVGWFCLILVIGLIKAIIDRDKIVIVCTSISICLQIVARFMRAGKNLTFNGKPVETLVSRIRGFFIRISIGWKIVWAREHIIVLSVERHDMQKLLDGNDPGKIELEISGMRSHLAGQIVKQTALLISDVDLLCAKAGFEANFEE